MAPRKSVMDVIRRNDYLASISSDISDIDREVRGFEHEIERLKERAMWAKSQKFYRFYMLQKREIRCLKKRIKRDKRSRKELSRIMYKANKIIS